MDRFRGDEAALEIGMDHARGRRRFVAGVNGPGARFLFAGREECAQAEQMINRANERVHAAVFDAEAAQIFQRLFFAQIDQFAFDLRADDDRFGGEMVSRVILDQLDMYRCDAGSSSVRSAAAKSPPDRIPPRCRRKVSALK